MSSRCSSKYGNVGLPSSNNRFQADQTRSWAFLSYPAGYDTSPSVIGGGLIRRGKLFDELSNRFRFSNLGLGYAPEHESETATRFSIVVQSKRRLYIQTLLLAYHAVRHGTHGRAGRRRYRRCQPSPSRHDLSYQGLAAETTGSAVQPLLDAKRLGLGVSTAGTVTVDPQATMLTTLVGPEKGTSLILTRLERKQSVMSLHYENLGKEAEM